MEVLELANIKSAKKRILVTEKRTAKNKSVRSKVKTAIKKVDAAIAANDKTAAEAALKVAVSELDKATKKGIYHKNTTARKVSRMTIAVNKLA
jgi:small subunit ribosomal protein S20